MLQVLIDLLNEFGYDECNLNIPLRDFVSSLDIVELICALEERYSLSIPEEDTYIFGENLAIIIEYLEKAGVKYETNKNEVI